MLGTKNRYIANIHKTVQDPRVSSNMLYAFIAFQHKLTICNAKSLTGEDVIDFSNKIYENKSQAIQDYILM